MIIDAGPLIDLERRPHRLAALVATYPDLELRTNEAVLAQVWRDPARQVVLTLFLANHGVLISPLETGSGKEIGQILAATRRKDVIDASLVRMAFEYEEPVLTTDPDDLGAFGIDVVPY